MAAKKKKRKKAKKKARKSTRKKARKTRRTPKLSAAALASYRRKKRALLHEAYKNARR